MKEHHLTLQYDEFKASLVVGGDCSLHSLAEFILQTVGFDNDHAFEFCDNLKNPYRSKERYSLFADMGEEDDANVKGVNKTLVAEVFQARKKMLFHFDYGDDWFFLLTCTSVKDSEVKKPFLKVLSKTGTPPVQYPGADEE